MEDVLGYVKPIASALQYAHDKRLIHRDVKPENILLGPNNEVWLSDFGIAAIAHRTGSFVMEKPRGTPPYMAPEQMRGKPCPASDQYALGIMTYEWLAGVRPFGGIETEITIQHQLEQPPSLREKVPAITPEVAQVVMIALAKDPQQRFGSVQAFARALEQASQVVPSLPAQIKAFRQPTPPVAPVAANPPGQSARPTERDMSTGTGAAPFPIREPVLPGKPQLPQPGISRRTVVLGLAGVIAAGTGIAWFAASHLSFSHLASNTSTSTPTPPLGTTLLTYKGHSSYVTTVAWSPDGKRIASGSYDKTVQVWDATIGGNVYTYKGHAGVVYAVAWSPDGRRIASGSYDGTVQVWDAITGGNVYTYKGHSSYVTAVAWSPDGKRIASRSDDKTVQVWDATTGGNVYTYKGHAGVVYAVAWSPDGRRIASGSRDNTVQVWSAG